MHCIGHSSTGSPLRKRPMQFFKTITKFDFLLRDVKFVVETDHKNLTFLKIAKSAKQSATMAACIARI
jgi:hypothetical protein